MDASERPRVAGHWPALDGLRGIAACVVVAYHGVAFSANGRAWADPQGLGPGVLLNGQLAVETFFVLSGFVLAGSLLRQGAAAELPQFYVRRVFRIHPPYVAAVLFAWCASFLYGPLSTGVGSVVRHFARVHLAPEALLPHLLFPGTAGLQLPVGWTLQTEMVFSLLLPAMWILARRAHWGPLLVLCLLPLALRVPVLQFAFDFGLGITLFCERERIAAWLSRVPLAGVVASLLVALLVGSLPRLLGWDRSLSERLSPTTILLQALGAAGLTALAASAPAVQRALAWRPFRFLGRVSYSLYLVHFPLAVLLASLVAARSAARLDPWIPLVLFAVAVPAAAVGHRFVERPSIAMGNRLCTALARRSGVRAVVSRLDLPDSPTGTAGPTPDPAGRAG